MNPNAIERQIKLMGVKHSLKILILAFVTFNVFINLIVIIFIYVVIKEIHWLEIMAWDADAIIFGLSLLAWICAFIALLLPIRN